MKKLNINNHITHQLKQISLAKVKSYLKRLAKLKGFRSSQVVFSKTKLCSRHKLMNQSTGFTIEVPSQKKSKCWRIWQQINLKRTLGWLLKILGSWMTLDMLRHSSEVQIRGTSSMNLAIHQLNEQASPKHISTICLEMLEEISREITSHSIEMPC